ncbi:hypothetical protein HPP92_026498 [Vanilla planifolia]|uniref:FAS1 domain-containing protein n=1 Tax=Vanilla planifolia TaxID=51239 RepID=A0A835PDB8_VANPL|nr:hypothetical protein HPP92_026498 [Vanilla planifolia]
MSIILTLWISPIVAQSPPSPHFSLSPSLSPAPAPAPAFVNLTYLFSFAGPFHTFLTYLTQTDVLTTFQNQANNTDEGITIFAPSDSAFSDLEKPSLTNLTKDQLRSLLLYHSFPKYYSLSDFKNLSSHSPVSTSAGGQYALNVTDTNGLIQVVSDWNDPKIVSSVYSTDPVAVYEINSVLLPKVIVNTQPALTPAPAPAPDRSSTSDLAPTQGNESGGAPTSSESGSNGSSHRPIVGTFTYFLSAAVFGAIVLMF